MQQLEEGEIELSVTAIDEVTWERIDQWPLFTEDFVLLTDLTHPLGGKGAVEITELEGQQIIARPYCEHAGNLSGILKERSIPVNGYHELSHDSDLGALVGEGPRRPAHDLMQQLEEGEIELSVTAIDEVTWERIDQWPLFTEDFVLLTDLTHPLGGKGAVEITELEGQQIIARPSGS